MNVIDYNNAFIQAIAKSFPRRTRTTKYPIPRKTRTPNNNEKQLRTSKTNRKRTQDIE